MARQSELNRSGRVRRGKAVSSRFRASPQPSGEGQDWERVMHTKLTQWRYMHLVALDELSHSEKKACAELAELGTVLETSVQKVHALEATAVDARAKRAKESFEQRATPALARLELALRGCSHAHDQVCNALLTALRRLSTLSFQQSSGTQVARELAKFREVAAAFVKAADDSGVYNTVRVADALDELAKVVMIMERDALANAATNVAAASDAVDNERERTADAIVRTANSATA